MKKIGIIFLILGFSGCFKTVDAPRCKSLADCPVTSLSCAQGYCFNDQPACPSGALDGCCAVQGDRSNNKNCLIQQLDLQRVIKDVTQKTALFGVPASDGNTLFVEAVTDHGMAMIGADTDGKRWHVKYKSDQKIPFTPAVAGGYALFPLGDGFSLWGPGMDVLLTSKDASIIQAKGYVGMASVFFYAGTKDGRVVTIDSAGKVKPVKFTGHGPIHIEPWVEKGMLMVCDDASCTFFDLTSKPAEPAELYSIALERPATGDVRLGSGYLWEPSGQGLDLYHADAGSAKPDKVKTINFDSKIKALGAFGNGKMWVLAGDAVTIVATDGGKTVLPGTKGPVNAIGVCNGLAVLGDKTGMYLGDRWQWTMDITAPSVQPVDHPGLVIWGARLAYISKNGSLMGIPLACE